jgi:glutaredoxin
MNVIKDVVILGNPCCSRCEIVKSLFDKESIPYTYVTIPEIGKSKATRYLGDAKAKGQLTMPIIIVDDIVRVGTPQEVMTVCK